MKAKPTPTSLTLCLAYVQLPGLISKLQIRDASQKGNMTAFSVAALFLYNQLSLNNKCPKCRLNTYFPSFVLICAVLSASSVSDVCMQCRREKKELYFINPTRGRSVTLSFYYYKHMKHTCMCFEGEMRESE